MEFQKLPSIKTSMANECTVADQTFNVEVRGSISGRKLKASAQKGEGVIITFDKLIDGYDKFQAYLQRMIGQNYSLDDPKKINIAFFMIEAGIKDIQSPFESSAGVAFSSSLAFTHIKGMCHPNDHISKDKKYRKVLPKDSALTFHNGYPHTISHTLSPYCVNNFYPLLTATTEISPKYVLDDGNLKGSGGVFCLDTNCLMLHGHHINNDTAYPTIHEPTVTEVISADGGSKGIKSEWLVALRDPIYQRSWYSNSKHDREKGAYLPLSTYADSVYHFIDKMNSSRSTTFENSGLWINLDSKPIEKITFILTFKLLFIVPKVDPEKRRQYLFENFKKELRLSMKKVDRPFEDDDC